jgi:Chitobiase/beta-hexosaminidase C-terminal domain
MTAALVRLLGRRRLLVVSAVVLVAGGLASGLLAYFSGAASAGSAGGAAATSVAPGTPPTSVSSQPGRAVTLSWEAAALANGQPVDGYLVTRYDASPPYAPQITLAGCGGVVTALSCTETAVPFGSWQYTITPVIANWRGTESTKSGTVTIGAGSLTLAQSTLGLAAFSGGSSPATLSGSLSGFATHEGVTYRLDDSTSGTTLAGSPAAADGSGNATVSITLPRPADGPHSIFAVGDAAPYPSQASAAILVDTLPPTSSAGGVDTAWHASDVVVGLSAVDGVAGSGVATITYEVDGGSSQTINGTSGNVTVPVPADGSNDGTHTIAFYATDDAGNVEVPAKTATVKIDATKPSTTLATTPAGPDGSNGWFQQTSVQFGLTGSDARSGVAQSFYTVDGGATQTYTGAVTVSGQGTHTITYWSVDNAGNTEDAKAGTIKLDNVEPSTSIAVTPAAPNGSGGWYATTPSFALSASDATSGVASTLYRIDSGATQTYSGAVSIPDGQHTITYWSEDSAGNTESATTTSTIKVDTVKPSTSIVISPASPDGTNGWRVSATSFTLSGSDATSGVASTLYEIDGGTTQTYTGSAVSIPQGSHTVSYWSVDTAGNTESATTSAAIKVDLDKPSTTLTTAPASPDGSNNWFQRSSVTFTLAATDATSGVANSYYAIDGGGQQTYSGTVTISTQGDHTVTYWSVDAAGNTEAAATTHIKLDNVKPVTTIATSPASPDGTNSWFQRSSVTFTLGASDASSGTASTLYTVDGGAQQTYSGTVTVSGQGDHTVTYWSVDNADNTETANTTHIKLDNVAPATTIATTPAAPDGTNNWFKRASVTFTLAATDATSGVANRFYTVDGGGQQTYSGTVTISTQGDHTLTYWSVDNAGNTETANTTHIKLDNVGPANSLALTNTTGGSFVGGSTVYYRGAAVGSFSIQNTVSDATSGAASSTFPALGGTTTGWTHTTPDVKTAPSGGPYVSNLFSWSAGTNSSPTEAVTGADAAGNTTTAPSLTFTNDSTAPATTDNTASIGTACKNTTQTVTLTPTDSASGAATTYYTTNSTTPTTSSSQGTSIALSAEGTYTIKYFTVDNVGNQEAVKTAATVICIDKTAPAPTNVVLANGNGTAGTADNRDTLAITYSEQLDATTFCSSWTNTGNQTLTGASIVAQITDTGSNDTLTITAVGAANCGGTGNFHLGSITLGGNYVGATRTFSGAQSQLTWNPTSQTLTVRLGTPSGGIANTGIAVGTPTYTPSSSLEDIAGNTITTSPFSPPAASRF